MLVTGLVFVVVLDANSASANQIGDLVLDTDGAHVRFAVVPDFTYTIEQSCTNSEWTAVGLSLLHRQGSLISPSRIHPQVPSSTGPDFLSSADGLRTGLGKISSGLFFGRTFSLLKFRWV